MRRTFRFIFHGEHFSHRLFAFFRGSAEQKTNFLAIEQSLQRVREKPRRAIANTVIDRLSRKADTCNLHKLKWVNYSR